MKKKIFILFFLAILLWAWPATASTLTVKSGDTLGAIAKANNVSVRELARLNGIKKINHIMPGQRLVIPGKGSKAIVSTVTRAEKQQAVRPTKAAIPPGAAYQHVYSREMGKPFAPRKDGRQDLTGEEYFRHRANIMKHGVSREGAESILSQKINSEAVQEDYLPNGTTVESVSFGKDEVWTRGVLININGKPGIKTKMYCAWTGECILDALNCGNYINPRQVRVPEGHPPIAIPQSPVPTKTPPCPTCPAQLEVDTGIYASIHDPGGPGETKGVGTFQETIWWENFAKDCSSEYWWGVGELGSAYYYSASDFPSKGWGGRLAAQAGLKRTWQNPDNDLSRQWVLKGRLGWEWSHWENPQKHWFIDQSGPVAGIYGEYRHELIYDKLWVFATAESWFGLDNQSVSSSFADTKESSRFFTELLVGVDYKFAPRWVLRGYAGIDLEGWSGEIPFVPGIELRHELKDDWGTVSVGLQAKFYPQLNPTLMGYAKWEITKPIKKKYREHRQKEVKLVGKGIGGRDNISPPPNLIAPVAPATPAIHQTTDRDAPSSPKSLISPLNQQPKPQNGMGYPIAAGDA